MAEQYFQESMAKLKDAEGMGKAKFLSIQDEYCHFLQVTGREEVSEFGPQLTSYLHGWPSSCPKGYFTLQAAIRHLLCTRQVPGSTGTQISRPRGHSQILALGK